MLSFSAAFQLRVRLARPCLSFRMLAHSLRARRTKCRNEGETRAGSQLFNRLSRGPPQHTVKVRLAGSEAHNIARRSCTVTPPRIHELAPLLQEVGALVSSLHLIWDGVRQSRFRHLTWKVGVLRNPVSKRGAEAMNRIGLLEIAEHL